VIDTASMADATYWWQLLCALAGLNLIAWTASTAWLHRNRPDGTTWPHQRLQLLLSALYVLGCGYRSVLPVFDVPRVVMVDSWASSVLVGRTVATIAELSFAAQWALLLRGCAISTGRRFSRAVAHAMLPMIAIAELNSWYAVLTTRNIGHVVEETLWGAAAVLSVLALLTIWPRATRRGRPWLALAIAAGSLYAAYMFHRRADVLGALAGRRGRRPDLYDAGGRCRRCRQPLACLARLGALAQRGGVDDALLQRRRLDQHCPGPCQAAAAAAAGSLKSAPSAGPRGPVSFQSPPMSQNSTAPAPATNFLRQRIEHDLDTGAFAGRHFAGTPGDAAHHAAGPLDEARIRTRFPPEPNGYLHIGHAKSICLNFGLARDYGGACHLRFDDTNPEKEELEYVNAIKEMVQWLGWSWGDNLYEASSYFDFMYAAAEALINAGHAYVDEQSADEMRLNRGDFGKPGTNSPFRDRTPAENLARFREMRDGRHADGAMVLRAKIDMASPNINLRDPTLYRIKHAEHHATGSKWCIYPMYTYAHPIEDALERITHSICTLEFEDQRPFYDWLLEHLADLGLL